MRTLFCAAILAGGLLCGCVDYTGGLCIPHADTFCSQEKTYWIDSCNRVENLLEECQCGCRADQTGCRTCGEKECESDADCPAGFYCDRADWLCKPESCVPDCTGKCCGDNGCGGACPSNCPGDQECNPVTCRCEQHCSTDADCAANQCCVHGQCPVMTCGAQECGPDSVCGKNCGDCPAGESCVNGVCQGGEPLCPPGQECIEVDYLGTLGCVIPPNSVPSGNQTGCSDPGGLYCDGNYTCHCADDDCSASVCVENCGTCPGDLICVEVMPDGRRACVTPDWNLPPDAPFCDWDEPCRDNATCFSDGTSNFCLHNCSSYNSTTCTDGETMCYQTILLVCSNGAWVEAVDCTHRNQVCVDGACINAAMLGEFCGEDLPCAPGLDCLGTVHSVHFFCTARCNCENLNGCDTGWECFFSDEDPTGPTCWCGKTCANNNPATDCPNGGNGWTCEETEPGSATYYCMVQ